MRDRDAILAELDAAVDEIRGAERRLSVALAYENVTARPGLWFRAVEPKMSVWVVGCNGEAIGMLWPGDRPFGTWTAARFGPAAVEQDRLGPFRHGRAAAVALAAACGVVPELPPVPVYQPTPAVGSGRGTPASCEPAG